LAWSGQGGAELAGRRGFRDGRRDCSKPAAAIGVCKMKKKRKKKDDRRTRVSDEQLLRRCDEIVELTDAFCRSYLDEDYLDLCREMVQDLYDIGFGLERGRPAGWASGIVHALGWVNFLYYRSSPVHMSAAEVAAGFGVSQGTMTAKSRLIRDELGLVPMDPDWCLPALVDINPLIWALEVDGMLVDIRSAPREMQEQAYLMGLIPYIPADRGCESDGGDRLKILKFPSEQNAADKSKSCDEMDDDTMPMFDGLDD